MEPIPEASIKSIREHELWLNSNKKKGRKAFLHDVNLAGVNFSGANLVRIVITAANLIGANFSKTNLNGASFSGSNLSSANLISANFSKANLTYVHFIEADLSKADLSNARLDGAHLSSANLSEAELRGANLTGAHLNKTNLSGADLRGADLTVASLSKANLSGADLSKAVLGAADLSGADLSGADFESADLSRAVFSSKLSLNELFKPLTEEQLASAIFKDEQKGHEKRRGADNNIYNPPSIYFRFKENMQWSLLDTSALLMGLQISYNRIHYLTTTKNNNLNDIMETVSNRPCYVGVNEDIYIKAINHNSPLEFELIQKAIEYIPEVFNAITMLCATVGAIAGSVLVAAKAYKTKQEGDKAKAEAETIIYKTPSEIEKIKEETKKLMIENMVLIKNVSIIPDILKKEHKKVIKDIYSKSDFEIRSPIVAENIEKLLSFITKPLANIIFKLYLSGVEEILCEMKYPDNYKKSSDKDKF